MFNYITTSKEYHYHIEKRVVNHKIHYYYEQCIDKLVISHFQNGRIVQNGLDFISQKIFIYFLSEKVDFFFLKKKFKTFLMYKKIENFEKKIIPNKLKIVFFYPKKIVVVFFLSKKF